MLLLLALLAGCAQGARPQQTVTDRETVAACRAHADEVYNRLNRATIYSIPQTGLPSSSTGLIRDPQSGLQQQYDYSERIDKCIRDSQAGTLTVGPTPGQGQGAAGR